MTITEIFACLSKLLTVYSKVSGVLLKVEQGKFYVSGVSRGQSFGFSVEAPDDIGDFTVIVAPSSLEQILKWKVTQITPFKDSLKVNGVLSIGENSPNLEAVLNPLTLALATEVTRIYEGTLSHINAVEDNSEICSVKDVLKPWQSLAKCGKKLFLTEDLTYTTGASASAFYTAKGACKNLPDVGEVLQVDSNFVTEVAVIQQATNVVGLRVYTLLEGTVFAAISDDKSVFAVEGTPLRIEKNTYERLNKRCSDMGEFDTITLNQSALRDVLLQAADKNDVKIVSGIGELSIYAGVQSTIKTDTTDFDCECEVAREHTMLALSALPIESEVLFGYGESGNRALVSLTVGDISIALPAQDAVEV